MPRLNSSAILAAEYNDMTATLRVWFAPHGRAYDYYGVPRYHFERLCRATSPGGYFNRHIAPYYGRR